MMGDPAVHKAPMVDGEAPDICGFLDLPLVHYPQEPGAMNPAVIMISQEA